MKNILYILWAFVMFVAVMAYLWLAEDEVG